MPIAEWVAGAQTGGPETLVSNPPGAAYFAIALVAAVVGLLVFVFIRTSARRAPHQ